MKQKLSLIFIMLTLLAAVFFVCITNTPVYGQASEAPDTPPSPKEIHYEQPLIENKPDETGKFRQSIPAPVDERRLMNSNEQYPPPGLRRALLGLMILMGITVYFLFIHNNLKKMVPLLGSVSRRVKIYMQSAATPSGASIAIEKEKLSNEAIIRDMVVEIEKDEELRGPLFRPFSLNRAIPPRPAVRSLGINDAQTGLHVIMSDSPSVSRIIAYNLIKQCSRLDQTLIFISSRISIEEIARGIIALETEKVWDAMDEQERYRITRRVEEFMDKYNGIHFLNNFKLSGNEIQEVITSLKIKSKPSAVIIDDFSSQSERDWRIILSNLNRTSKKEGIPIFILDNTRNEEKWNSMKNLEFKSIINAAADGENVVISNLLQENKEAFTTSIDYLSGKLEATAP